MTTKKKKDQDLNDLIAVSIIALIAVFAYDKEKNPAQVLDSVISASFVILILVALLIVSLLLFSSRRTSKLEQTKVIREDLQFVDLYWGQALKHDLLIFFIPVLILSLPIFSGQIPDFTDLLQAALAFVSLIYIKILYWKRAF